MPSPATPDYALLARYVADECSGIERAHVEAWAAAHESHRRELEALRAVYANTARPAQTFHADEAWDRVDSRTRAIPVKPLAASQRSWMSWSAMGTLAVATLVFGGVLRERHITRSAPVTQHYATLAAQRTTITLDDGTQFTLAPMSTLDVPAEYAAGNRAVRLQGEGYFSVVHDTQHPFVVLTHNATITDVGTEFDVRAYDTDVRVSVARGEVLAIRAPLPRPLPFAFGAGRGEFINDAREGGSEKRAPSAPVSATRPYDGNDTAYLTAGDVAEATDTGFTVMHHANIAEIGAWRQGHLVFEDVPLQSAARDLERTFNLTITIADTVLAHRHITASFEGESLSQILDDIAGIVGGGYQLTGRSVIFLARRSSSVPDHNSGHPESLRTAQMGETHE